MEEHEGDGKKILTQLSQKYTGRMSEGLRDGIRSVSAYCLSCYSGGNEGSFYASATTYWVYISPYFHSATHIVAACTDLGFDVNPYNDRKT